MQSLKHESYRISITSTARWKVLWIYLQIGACTVYSSSLWEQSNKVVVEMGPCKRLRWITQQLSLVLLACSLSKKRRGGRLAAVITIAVLYTCCGNAGQTSAPMWVHKTVFSRSCVWMTEADLWPVRWPASFGQFQDLSLLFIPGFILYTDWLSQQLCHVNLMLEFKNVKSNRWREWCEFCVFRSFASIALHHLNRLGAISLCEKYAQCLV